MYIARDISEVWGKCINNWSVIYYLAKKYKIIRK